MPRRKRHLKINSYDLQQIDQQIGLLRIATRRAQISLTPLREHYNALSELDGALHRALNLLNDRPADYREPHHAPMSQG